MSTISPIYLVANANKCNTPLEVKMCIEMHYPDMKGKFSDEEIYQELLDMRGLCLNGTYLYPDIVVYGKHKYHITNSGQCYHEDTINEYVDESDDFTWTKTVYTVDIDLLPKDLRGADDERLSVDILNYHYGIIEKPVWVLS